MIQYTKLATSIAIVVFFAGTHYKAYHSGSKSVQSEWDAERLANTQQSLQVAKEAAEKTAAMQAESDKIRSVKNAQIIKLNHDLAAAIDSLRNRPERPIDIDLSKAANSGSATGCTGASLYKQDAGFLTSEAARADRLLSDLVQCQAAYLAAREALK